MRTRLTQKEHAYLIGSRVCRVASVGRDGWVHAAPLSHAYDPGRRTLYVATDPGGRTARNLRARPRAAVAPAATATTAVESAKVIFITNSDDADVHTFQ